jgi:hypothetical protein
MFDWFSVKDERGAPRPRSARQGRSRGRLRYRASSVLQLEPLETRTLPDANHLLIGTWNVDFADTNGSNRNTTYFQTVLQAIGQEDTYAAPQPIDVLTLTEVRSNAVSGSNNDTDWVAQQLNALYGSGTYSHPTGDAASSGGGTEGVVYNTRTVQLLQTSFVGTLGSNGTERQEYRYHFHPLAVPDGSADFYVYVGHYKCCSGSTNQSRRNVEAQQIRADADALGANVPILYTGDFNIEASTEPMWSTLTRSANGQMFDPINREGSWDYNSAFADIDTLKSTGLNGRFDWLGESGAALSSRDGHFQDMPTTYHPFGNNGSVGYNHAVNAANSTALPDLSNRTTVLTDLTHTSDHVPQLEDFQIGGAQQTGATQFSVVPSANPVNAGSSFTVTVSALDSNGNVVPSYRGQVHFSSTDGAASLPSNYTFTASDNGVHRFSVTLRTPGDQTITVTDTSNGSITGSTDVTVNPVATQLGVVPDANPVAPGQQFHVTVSALDANGNLTPNYRGTVHFTSSDPAAQLPNNYTFTAADNGVHTFPLTLNTPGDQTITARDTLNSSISGSTDVIVSAAGASQIAVGVPANVTAGVPFQATLTAEDANGNVVPSYTGTVHIVTTLNQMANYTFTPADQGTHTFTLRLRLAGAETVTVTDTSDPSINGSANFTVNAAAATHLVVQTPPGPATPGVPFDVRVVAADPFGNPDPLTRAPWPGRPPTATRGWCCRRLTPSGPVTAARSTSPAGRRCIRRATSS